MNQPDRHGSETRRRGRADRGAAWIGSLALALALLASPAGWAQEDPPASQGAGAGGEAAAGQSSSEDGSKDEKHLVYKLSYIESDRAMPLLCALGYGVTVLGSGGCEAPKSAENRPTILQLPDSKNVSFDPPSTAQLGGTELGNVTEAIPQQRLLIRYKESKDGREELETLLELLHGQIDVPAKQILIEALVIELDRDRLKDLGFGFTASKDGSTSSFGFNEVGSGSTAAISFLPFTYVFERPSAKTLLEFTGRIAALVDDGDAAVLSRPSILVLDGRQARISVSDLVPYALVTTTDFGTSLVSGTKYLPVGIVLNLRPRASDDNSQVTMQVEVLISSTPPSGTSPAAIGPRVASREVSTSVRVANNTPFIIGGLISKSESEQVSGIPGLSKIPGIGRLFRRNVKIRDNKEAIVVIVPHVIPPDDRAFSYTIAKDSDLFNQFDLDLFRNVYRVRSDDVLDLDFIRESAFYQCIERTAQMRSSDLQKLFASGKRKPVVPGDTAGLVAALREWALEDPETLLSPIVAYLYQHHFGDYLSSAELANLAKLIRAKVKANPTGTACWQENFARELQAARDRAKKQGGRTAIAAQTAKLGAGAFLALIEPPEAVATELNGKLQEWADTDALKLLDSLQRALVVAGVDASVVTDQVIRLLAGRIPGESILVKRMLLEIVENLELGDLVDDRKIIFYEEDADRTDGDRVGKALLDLQRLVARIDEVYPLDRSCNTVGVLYGTSTTTGGMLFDPPSAKLHKIVKDGSEKIDNKHYVCELRKKNCLSADGSRWDKLGILLNACYEPSRGRSTLDRLKSVLVLKRVLDLNPSLPLTLKGFHVGLDVVFPTEEDLRSRSHLVDREAAELYFEVVDYYYAFELAIRNGLKSIETLGLPQPPDCRDESRDLEQSTSKALDENCACVPEAPSLGAQCRPWAVAGATPPSQPSGASARPGGETPARAAENPERRPEVRIAVDYTPHPSSAPPPAAPTGVLADAILVPLPPAPGTASFEPLPDGPR